MQAFTDNTVDLFGKTVNDLQSGAFVSNNTLTAQLNYIADYTSAGYDMSLGNHFFVVKAIPSISAGSTISFKFNGTTKNLDADGILIIQMTEEKKSLDVEFTETNALGEEVSTYTLHLTGLTLKPQEE